MLKPRKLLTAGLRLLCVPAFAGMAGCQTMGSSAEQRAFVAAHVVRGADNGSADAIYIAQDGAFARADGSATARAERADARP